MSSSRLAACTRFAQCESTGRMRARYGRCRIDWISPAAFHNQAVTRALAASGSGQKPNIVLILSDDVGYGDLGCYGAKLPRTPHIDGLAQCGRRFTDGHADASVCKPSRYAILSGMYAWRRRDAQSLPGD